MLATRPWIDVYLSINVSWNPGLVFFFGVFSAVMMGHNMRCNDFEWMYWIVCHDHV